MEKIKVTVYFRGDSSVGIRPYFYSMEIPTFDMEYREEVREKIRTLYTDLDAEFSPEIYFDDEPID